MRVRGVFIFVGMVVCLNGTNCGAPGDSSISGTSEGIKQTEATDAGRSEKNKVSLQENAAQDGTVTGGQVDVSLDVRYVDSMDIMQNSEKGRAAAADLDAKRVSFGKEIERNGEKLEQKAKEFADKKVAMSNATRENFETKLAKEQRSLKLLIEDRERELKVAMSKVTEELFRELEKIVAQVAQKENLGAVIDIASGRALYVDESLNFSDRVVVAWDNTKHQESVMAHAKQPKNAASVTA